MPKQYKRQLKRQYKRQYTIPKHWDWKPFSWIRSFGIGPLPLRVNALEALLEQHSFIPSGYFYSASSRPLLLRGANDTVCIPLKRNRQLRVKDLPKVPTWWPELDSNPRPFGRGKAPKLPNNRHAHNSTKESEWPVSGFDRNHLMDIRTISSWSRPFQWPHIPFMVFSLLEVYKGTKRTSKYMHEPEVRKLYCWWHVLICECNYTELRQS